MAENDRTPHALPEEYFGDSCVAFIDCLGFAAAVDHEFEAAISVDDLLNSRLVQGLKWFHAQAGVSNSVKSNNPDLLKIMPRFRVFSDSAFVYVPQSADGHRSLIGMVQDLTIMLAHEGLFIRGAIVVGKLYESENLVIGPAINEAVKLEKMSRYPRVILSRAAADFAMSTTRETSRNADSLREAQDGCWHIRHLHPWRARGEGVQEIGTDYFDDYCDRVTEKINRQLSDHACSEEVRAKLEWLKTELETSKDDWDKNFQLR